MASVDIIALRKLYGDAVALSDININIPSGSFYTLLGPSGCGKTTLLRAIAGFHGINAGEIRVKGQAIHDLPAYRRDVGMVFQDYAIFPHLSVRDNVAFGLKQRKVPSAEIATRVQRVLDVVQLGHLAARMPHELSGGQQQRVGLARAIVIEPKVLLMDEPLSNLDAQLRVDLRVELRRIQQDLGITTIYVTHDQEEALAMSDTVCVMYGGVIQQASDPLTIYNRPANRFVATFVGANNFLAVDQQGRNLMLRASGTDVSGLISDRADKITCAVRPEHVSVRAGVAASGDSEILIPAKLSEVSFIGREMEVFVKTNAGDTIKALARPDPTIINLSHGADVTLSLRAQDLSFFEDSVTGARLS